MIALMSVSRTVVIASENRMQYRIQTGVQKVSNNVRQFHARCMRFSKASTNQVHLEQIG